LNNKPKLYLSYVLMTVSVCFPGYLIMNDEQICQESKKSNSKQ
jgi:hypothetical protein